MKILPSLIVSIFVVAYVTATDSTAQQQQQQPQRVQQQAEVNHVVSRPKFGTKTAIKSPAKTQSNSSAAAAARVRASKTVSVSSTQTQNVQAVPKTVPRISRRYDAPGAAPAQLVTQYDIPIVSKNRASNSKGQRQRARGDNAENVPVQRPSNASQPQRLRPNSNSSHSNVRSQSKSAGNVPPQRSIKSAASARKIATTTTTTTSSTTTTTTTTTTQRPTLFGNFQLDNPFNLFQPNFWNLSNPPSRATSTKKPPKKYTPSPVPPTLQTKDDKRNYLKAKANSKATTEIASSAVAPTKESSEGPFRIALPTLGFFNAQKATEDPAQEKEKRNIVESLRARFNCPRESEVRFQLFPKICKVDKDCSVWNRDELCCEIFGAKSCVSGLPKPLEETSHAPILGLIPRKCPSRPLAELWWEMKECETDMDCWPRVCCPDGHTRYCRTSQPELETVPVPVKRSFNYLAEYLECTPPPPPIFDLHPKTCTSTLDCFPNVCCQEAGLRHCRPPKKSVLTLMANFLNVDFVKRLTQNIVIK